MIRWRKRIWDVVVKETWTMTDLQVRKCCVTNRVWWVMRSNLRGNVKYVWQTEVEHGPKGTSGGTGGIKFGIGAAWCRAHP